MGKSNPQLRDALKKLSSAKFGRPRAEVEKEIFARLGAGDAAKKIKLDALKMAQQEKIDKLALPAQNNNPKTVGKSTFLDDWLAKRQQISSDNPKTLSTPKEAISVPAESKTALAVDDALNVRDQNMDDGVSIKLR
jgi:hypothetical protein